MKIQTVLWDNDNTLVRTEAVAFRVVETVLNGFCRTHGKQFDAVTLQKRYAGDQMREICVSVFQEHDIPHTPDDLDQLVKANTAGALTAMGQFAEESPGVSGVLQQLRDLGIASYVVTSSEIGRVSAGLRKTGLDRFFPADAIYTVPNSLPDAGLSATPKPDPAIYNLAIAQRGLDRATTVAIEDSASGVRAAVAAGITVIGYTGADPLSDSERSAMVQKLDGAGALRIVHDMENLLRTINTLSHAEAAAHVKRRLELLNGGR
jgi:beta-phosphoglucomutase-like phosphatase (HAD superfamily)